MSKTIPDAALNQHITILGKTGSGKTYAAKGIVEGLLAEHRQVCVLDPTGAWWGLRLGADGKGKGYDIVLLGGKNADIPLAERSGAAVARLVTEQGASVVIDTSGFTVGEYTRWFIDFAGTLYTTIRDPLHLVIDEAHYFAPQGGGKVDPDTGKMIHAANRLMSGGRSKGVRGLLITQRPAKLHKDSLTCADTLIAMRVIAPQDRQAVKDWIDGAGTPEHGKIVLDSLAGLQKGEGWVWYPEGGHLERVKFPKIKTYDSSATPEHGAKAGPKVGEIDLNAVRSSMAEAVREAEANDPKLLRAKIAELQAAAKKGTPGPVKVQTIADPKAVERAVAERDRHWKGELAKIQKAHAALAGRLGQIGKLAHLNGEAVVTVNIPPEHVAAIQQSIERTRGNGVVVAGPATAARSRPSVAVVDGLPKPQSQCLDALAWFRAIGIESPSKEQLCFRLGWSPSSSHITNVLGALRTAGMVDGYRLVADVAAPDIGTLAEYHNQIRKFLDQPRGQLFDLLLSRHPDELDKDAACEALGWSSTSSHITNVVGSLRSYGIVEKRGWGLTSMVFPEGLR